MLNHIVVMGRLTHDPELRKTASGVSVASFSVAVDRDFSQQDGKKETDFLDVVAWRNTAEFAAKYFTKGRMAVVSGCLQIRTRKHTVLKFPLDLLRAFKYAGSQIVEKLARLPAEHPLRLPGCQQL